MKTNPEKVGYIKALLQTWFYEHNAHMPAVVNAVNDNGTVDLRFAIKKPRMRPDGNRFYEASEIHEQVPVMLPSCGGFSINLPIKPGCKGYVHHSDLDQDNFFLGNVDADGISEPHTARYHSFTDIVFEPAFNGVQVDGDCLELKSPTVTLKICENGFDVVYNGESMIDKLNACCDGSFAGWKP